MRNSLSFHGITADDLKAGGGARVGLYVAANDGQVSFGIDRVHFWFDSPAEFAAWLTKLNALAADTPCVAGVCPCCSRSFENLQRHIASQHPTFGAETPEAAS